MAGWWSCGSGTITQPFRSLHGSILIQSRALMQQPGTTAKMQRHLGWYAKAQFRRQILWATAGDTIPIEMLAKTPLPGLRVIWLDTAGTGIDRFLKQTIEDTNRFTIVISPLPWRETVVLHNRQPTGQLWICTAATFQRDALSLDGDILISPGRTGKYLFKLKLNYTTPGLPLTDISGLWFQREQLRVTLSQVSRGKYPAQPVSTWAPSPTLLKLYQSIEAHADSLTGRINGLKNSMLLNIIPG